MYYYGGGGVRVMIVSRSDDVDIQKQNQRRQPPGEGALFNFVCNNHIHIDHYTFYDIIDELKIHMQTVQP